MALPGLPPLPKSLIDATTSISVATANLSLQDEFQIEDSVNTDKTLSSSPKPDNVKNHLLRLPTSRINSQLSALRREMVKLRQLDLSLLSQLWTLNESIEGFRKVVQDRDTLSLPSPSYSDTNSTSSGHEDVSIAQDETVFEDNKCPAKVDDKCHLQLHKILEKPNRAPPPLPSSRRPSLWHV